MVVVLLLDFATAFAFWLQADTRTTEDTIRLILFVAVTAGLIDAVTVLAFVRGVARLAAPPR